MTSTPLPDSEELKIKAGGKTLGGWLSVRVERAIERLPSGFAVELTERFPGQASTVPVDPGTPAQVFLGNDLILTGYIDLYEPTYDGQQHTVRIEGRSMTEDIVDCSIVPGEGQQWVISGGVNFGQIAKDLCAPFGVAVVGGDIALPGPMTFSVNPGETVAELLEYMARSTELLMYDDPQGRLVLSQVGTVRAGSPLVEGVNCEVAHARLSMDQRFSRIDVVAQVPAKGGDTAHLTVWWSEPDKAVSSIKRLDGQPRYRPLLIVMDMPGTAGTTTWAQQRANWEVARRYGRSRVVDVTVTGWRDGNGALWTPNTLTKVKLPTAKVEQDMLIAACAWLRGPAGTSTVLTLMPPEGFQPAPATGLPGFYGAIPEIAGGYYQDSEPTLV